MRAEIEVNGSPDAAAGYLGWTPCPVRVRLVAGGEYDGGGGNGGPGATVPVLLRNRDRSTGGQLLFYADPAAEPVEQMELDLPADGSPVKLHAGGELGRASVEDGDAALQVVERDGGSVLGERPLMVRIRKNAETLTEGERDRFLHAFALLNDEGFGRFRDFREMHTFDTSREAHGEAGFLPWHRAYLLDLERELQSFDPSVALPYWRFDEPAPNLFTPAFLGDSDPFGRVRFDPSNPLRQWTTDGQVGIRRLPSFDTATSPAGRPSSFGFRPVLDEASTLRLGHDPGDPAVDPVYDRFRDMEGNPHGSAHVSFQGYVSSIDTAARDPLFFLLHTNVDRLWAKWQWLERRFDVASTDSYPHLGRAGDAGATRVGHNLRDSMWPWNQVTGFPRPSSAPGGTFPPSPVTAAPGDEPEVGTMVAFQDGGGAGRLGFDYDDVPYEA